MSETSVWPAPKQAQTTIGQVLSGESACPQPRNAFGVVLNVYVVSALAAATGVVFALLLPGAKPIALLAAVAAGFLLLIGHARLDVAESQRSWLPLRDLVLVAGSIQLMAALFELTGAAQLRHTSAVAVAVAAVSVLGTLLRARLAPARSTMLVGDRLALAQCITHWSDRDDLCIRGVFLVEPPLDESRHSDVLGVPVVGDLRDVVRVSVAAGIDNVIVAPGPLVTAYDVRRLSWSLEGTRVRVGVTAEVHGAAPRRIRPRLFGRRVVLTVQPSTRPPLIRWLKGVIDRVAAALLLVGFAPLIGALALLVRLDSRGPAFFAQTRTGQYGVRFTMYKLRTMHPDAEDRLAELRDLNEGAGPLFKLRNDPRTTRFGRILRTTSLDELPQLFNVVRGQMSLIGPRPGLPAETDMYDDWVARRLAVRPGMTGLWQVSGRSSLTWEDSVGLDLGYVDNWTLGGDLAIAAKTLKAVVQRDGAS